VKRQDVDGASLAEDAERNLGGDEPSIGLKDADHLLDEGGVIGVQQAVEALAAPFEPAEQPRAQRGDNTIEVCDRYSIPLALLHAAYDTA